MLINVFVVFVVFMIATKLWTRRADRLKSLVSTKEPLMASSVEIERKKQQNIFIQDCAKRDYEVFSSERMKPETDTHGVLRHASKHKNNVLLINLLKDTSNMQTYLNYFHSLGWFIKAEIVKDKKDFNREVLDVSIQSTPFDEEK